MNSYYYVIIGILLERVSSFIILYKCLCIQFPGKQRQAFWKSLLLALFYLDPVYMLIQHEKQEEKQIKRQIQKLRLQHQILQTIFDFNIQITCSSNLIFQYSLLRNENDFSIVHLSLGSSLASISNRLTQIYIRRIQQRHNYIWSKKVRSFDSLTESEKNIIFYPKISIMPLHQFKDRQQNHKNEFYCIHQFNAFQIAWIWIYSFITCLGFALCLGFIGIVTRLPYWGFFGDSEGNDLENQYYSTNLKSPYLPFLGTLFLFFFYNLIKFLASLFYSRGYSLKSYFSSFFLTEINLNFFQKIFIFSKKIFIFLVANFYDFSFLLREEIPLFQIFNKNQQTQINENWIDNPEPQAYITFSRIAIQVFVFTVFSYNFIHFYKVPQQKTQEIILKNKLFLNAYFTTIIIIIIILLDLFQKKIYKRHQIKTAQQKHQKHQKTKIKLEVKENKIQSDLSIPNENNLENFQNIKINTYLDEIKIKIQQNSKPTQLYINSFKQ